MKLLSPLKLGYTPSGDSDATTKRYVDSELQKKANSNSPKLSGVPTTPTADITSNDDTIASTQFVHSVVDDGNFSTKEEMESHVTNMDNPHNVTKTQLQIENVDNTSDADKPISTAQQSEFDKKVDKISRGVAGGIAELDESGKVPSSQLPGYVDDVLEGTAQDIEINEITGSQTAKSFIIKGTTNPCTPEEGKIYIDIDSNIQFRWSGSLYVSTGSSIALGDTQYTAGRGDWTKEAYEHSQSDHSPSDAEKNVIVGLQKNGTDLTVDDTTRKVNIEVPTKTSELDNDKNFVTSTKLNNELSSLANSITVGGTNLLNSSSLIGGINEDTANWYLTHDEAATTTFTDKGLVMTIPEDSDDFLGVNFVIPYLDLGIDTGDTISVSFDYCMEESSNPYRPLYIEIYQIAVNDEGQQGSNIIKLYEFVPDTGVTSRFSLSETIPIFSVFGCETQLVVSISYRYASSFVFKNLKLEKGSKPTDWTPSIGDTTYELKNKINKSEKGTAGGVATLDEAGKLPLEQLPEVNDSKKSSLSPDMTLISGGQSETYQIMTLEAVTTYANALVEIAIGSRASGLLCNVKIQTHSDDDKYITCTITYSGSLFASKYVKAKCVKDTITGAGKVYVYFTIPSWDCISIFKKTIYCKRSEDTESVNIEFMCTKDFVEPSDDDVTMVTDIVPIKEGWLGNAESATKAEQDGNGNIITDTYATKQELDEVREESGQPILYYDSYEEFMADYNNIPEGASVSYPDPETETNVIRLANNLTTEEEGFALDARQGKVLKDDIDDLNESLHGFKIYTDVSQLGLVATDISSFVEIIDNMPNKSIAFISFGENVGWCSKELIPCSYGILTIKRGIDSNRVRLECDDANSGNSWVSRYYSSNSNIDDWTLINNNVITDYTSKIVKNTTNVDSLWTTSIKKIGHNVNVVMNITVNAISSKTAELGTFPTEVLPSQSIVVNTLSNNGKPCYIYIDTDGQFGYVKTTETSWVSGDGVRMCFSYTTNK